jgi:hypothetical protein
MAIWVVPKHGHNVDISKNSKPIIQPNNLQMLGLLTIHRGFLIFHCFRKLGKTSNQYSIINKGGTKNELIKFMFLKLLTE